MNNKTNHITSQQKESKRFDIKSEFDSNLNLSDLALMKYFFQQRSIHPYFFYSHRYLAQVTGLSYSTVKRSIRRLEKFGYLTSVKRPYQSCLYFLDAIFSLPHIKEQVKKYFKIGFLMSLLFSYYTHQAKSERVVILKDNISNNLPAADLKKAKQASPQSPVHYREPTRWDNPHDQMFEEWLAREKSKPRKCFNCLIGECMLPFTEEQLAAIAEYPSAAVAVAQKALTREMHAGKAISNPYNYFISICKKESSKQPSTGRTETPSRPKHGPQSVYKHVTRELETDYEFAFNVETKLHKWRITNPEDWAYAKQYPNPKLKLLTLEEQQQIMAVHEDCSCRQNVDNSLKRLGEFVTKPHDLRQETDVFPVYGVKTNHQPPESQLPPQPFNSFDEQYTPLVDALYEGYEECLD